MRIKRLISAGVMVSMLMGMTACSSGGTTSATIAPTASVETISEKDSAAGAEAAPAESDQERGQEEKSR